MANPLKGEVDFTALGQTWTLRCDIDELIAAEALTGKTIMEMVASPGLGTVRALMLAGLKPHHPEANNDTFKDILGDLGFAPLAAIVGEAVMLAFPKKKEGAGPAAARPPRKPAKGRAKA